MRRTYISRSPERLIIELVATLLQCISEAVVALLAPSVDGYIFLLCTGEPAFEELPLFILEVVILLESEE